MKKRKKEEKKLTVEKTEAQKSVLLIRGAETCIICGDIIPEGRIVCFRCERELTDGGDDC